MQCPNVVEAVAWKRALEPFVDAEAQAGAQREDVASSIKAPAKQSRRQSVQSIGESTEGVVAWARHFAEGWETERDEKTGDCWNCWR